MSVLTLLKETTTLLLTAHSANEPGLGYLENATTNDTPMIQ